MVAKRAARCGDGTYNLSEQDVHENAVWGYGDKDLHVEDIQELQWTLSTHNSGNMQIPQLP